MNRRFSSCPCKAHLSYQLIAPIVSWGHSAPRYGGLPGIA